MISDRHGIIKIDYSRSIGCANFTTGVTRNSYRSNVPGPQQIYERQLYGGARRLAKMCRVDLCGSLIFLKLFK